MTGDGAGSAELPGIDTTRPHPARMYDYSLGGKNHFAADREVADKVFEAFPSGRITARENRGFLKRAVQYLTAEAGVRQFLDIGTGLPTTSNVHEVAQAIAPECRVVYSDNDPMVLAHARALLTSSDEGRTAYIQADLHDPQSILSAPETRETLDFSQPIALMLVAVLHYLPDADRPADIVSALVDALPSGSYVVASHVTQEHEPEQIADVQEAFKDAAIDAAWRNSDDFARLTFGGLDLVPPGVTLVSEWRPEGNDPRPSPAEVGCYGGVGRKA